MRFEGSPIFSNKQDSFFYSFGFIVRKKYQYRTLEEKNTRLVKGSRKKKFRKHVFFRCLFHSFRCFNLGLVMPSFRCEKVPVEKHSIENFYICYVRQEKFHSRDCLNRNACMLSAKQIYSISKKTGPKQNKTRTTITNKILYYGNVPIVDMYLRINEVVRRHSLLCSHFSAAVCALLRSKSIRLCTPEHVRTHLNANRSVQLTSA